MAPHPETVQKPKNRGVDTPVAQLKRNPSFQNWIEQLLGDRDGDRDIVCKIGLSNKVAPNPLSNDYFAQSNGYTSL